MYTSTCNSDSALTGFLAGRADNNNGYNNGMGWGMDGWWGLIIILALFGYGGFGGGFGGGWNNGAGNAQFTDAAVQRGFDTQTIIGKLDGINSGICSLGYDQLAQMNNLGLAIANGFHGVDNAVCTLGYQTQQGFNGVDNAVCTLGYNMQSGFNATQAAVMQGDNAIQNTIQSCCCDLRSGLKDIQYQNATDTCALQTTMLNNTRDIIDSQNAGTRAILDYLCQEKIADLQQENQTLRLAASQSAQNQYLISELRPCAKPAYITCSPFQSAYGFGNYGGYGYNNGCGCNSGCCGCNG